MSSRLLSRIKLSRSKSVAKQDPCNLTTRNSCWFISSRMFKELFQNPGCQNFKQFIFEAVFETSFTFLLSIEEVGIPRAIPCSTPGSRLKLGPPPSPPPCGPPPLDLRLRAPLPPLPGLLLPILGERSRVSGGGSRSPGGQEGSDAGGAS